MCTSAGSGDGDRGGSRGTGGNFLGITARVGAEGPAGFARAGGSEVFSGGLPDVSGGGSGADFGGGVEVVCAGGVAGAGPGSVVRHPTNTARVPRTDRVVIRDIDVSGVTSAGDAA